jgi:hypothetical protein
VSGGAVRSACDTTVEWILLLLLDFEAKVESLRRSTVHCGELWYHTRAEGFTYVSFTHTHTHSRHTTVEDGFHVLLECPLFSPPLGVQCALAGNGQGWAGGSHL